MKKVLFFIAFITLPVISIGQTNVADKTEQNDVVTVETSIVQQNETKIVLSTTAKAEVNDLSYKKSIELISIKAYKRSLQIKVKDIKHC
jgi:hypothetical protein